MSADEALAGRLEAFLAARGTTIEMLLATVGEPYGRPLLVVATGSILHGLGNERSDIDINIVVEQEVTPLPIPTYTPRLLVDTTYFSASEVEKWVSALRDQPWPLTQLDRAQWKRRHSEFFNCTRFGYGLVLSARDGRDLWMAELRKPWLAERVANWWRVESVRRWLGGRWLANAKPLLAAQRQLDAVLAKLESRVAAAGHPYFGPKWLPEKLRTLGDSQGLAVLHEVMRAPTTEREARSYAARCEVLMAELGGGDNGDNDDMAAQLWYLDGVKLRKIDGGTLVSRWNLRGLELRGAAPAATQPSGPLWEGGLNVQPPADVLALFIEDMTWLSMVARTT